jgi:hypothetical protein
MTDRWAGTRCARLVLADDIGVRATVTAHWLKQLGWEVYVLDRALEGVPLESGTPNLTSAADLPDASFVDIPEAARLIEAGARAISVDPSALYRQSHPSGALWATRARLDRLPVEFLRATAVVVWAADEVLARLAAHDLAQLTAARVVVARGGPGAWKAAGLALEATPDTPPDADRIDFLFWAHDRHDGNPAAMRTYLGWEADLPGQIGDPATAGYRLGPVAPAANPAR